LNTILSIYTFTEPAFTHSQPLPRPPSPASPKKSETKKKTGKTKKKKEWQKSSTLDACRRVSIVGVGSNLYFGIPAALVSSLIIPGWDLARLLGDCFRKVSPNCWCIAQSDVLVNLPVWWPSNNLWGSSVLVLLHSWFFAFDIYTHSEWCGPNGCEAIPSLGGRGLQKLTALH